MCNNKFQIVLQAPDLLSAKTLIEQNVIGRRQVRTQWPRSLNLSHNLSWRGGGGGWRINWGAFNFFWMEYGGP